MIVAVGVSGGMDSLLSLALLKEAGHEVIALHAHFLPPGGAQLRLAQSLQAQCDHLGVAFHAADLSGAFHNKVIEPFVAAYVSGLTPNPCAGCNRDMKFGLLLEQARILGAERLATGHYARLDSGLRRGHDPRKDQSYFLTLVPREALEAALFPLGSWLKADVPQGLARRGLAPPLPSESQEVCFIPGDDYRAFLEARGVPLPGGGPVVLRDGREIGRHHGLWRHTIGQRKGIGIAWSEPLYVLDKEPQDNRLVVGPKSALKAVHCHARDVNYLLKPDRWPEEVLCQTCYRQRPRPARAVITDRGLTVTFNEPLPRPTPGQIAAVYDVTGRALAGGIIA